MCLISNLKIWSPKSRHDKQHRLNKKTAIQHRASKDSSINKTFWVNFVAFKKAQWAFKYDNKYSDIRNKDKSN